MITTSTPLPTMIPRGKAKTLSFAPIDGASAQVPTAGSWVLRRPDNTEILTQTPSLGATSTVTIDATDLEDESLGTGWVEEWTFTVGGVTKPPMRREAYLIRSDLVPVISDEDLYGIRSDLRNLLPDSLDDYGAYRDAAWYQILARLIAVETLPQTVVSAWALRTVHLYLTLHLIAADFGTQEAGQGRWVTAADKFYDRYEIEYGRLQLKVDLDEDGDIDAKEVVVPVIYTAGKAAVGRRYRLGRRGRR